MASGGIPDDTEFDAQLEFTPTDLGSGSMNQNMSRISVDDRTMAIDTGERFQEDFVVQDRYTILGKGFQTIVFEATKKMENKKFAIKRILKNSIKDQHKREVLSLAQLDHAGIVRYFNAWIEPESNGQKQCLYIQLELCSFTLGEWLLKNKNRTKETVEDYFKQIVEALHYIHSNDYIHTEKIIHRDLKPSNIFIGVEGNVKIGDFGLAKILTEQEYNSENTVGASSHVEHSQMKGTPDYMSPEQINRQTYGTKSDIFSLGLIFLEMCVVISPENKKQIFTEAREGKFPEQTLFKTKVFEDLLTHMISHDPEQRFTASKILNHEIFNKTRTSKVQPNMEINITNVKGSNVMIGNNNVMNVSMTSDIQHKKAKILSTKPITVSNQQPTRDQLLDIKGKVGRDWKDLGRRLDFNDAVLDQMQVDNTNNTEELVYEILKRWIQRDAENATKAKLANIFIKLNRGDLADILADD